MKYNNEKTERQKLQRIATQIIHQLELTFDLWQTSNSSSGLN